MDAFPAAPRSRGDPTGSFASGFRPPSSPLGRCPTGQVVSDGRGLWQGSLYQEANTKRSMVRPVHLRVFSTTIGLVFVIGVLSISPLAVGASSARFVPPYTGVTPFNTTLAINKSCGWYSILTPTIAHPSTGRVLPRENVSAHPTA